MKFLNLKFEPDNNGSYFSTELPVPLPPCLKFDRTSAMVLDPVPHISGLLNLDYFKHILRQVQFQTRSNSTHLHIPQN